MIWTAELAPASFHWIAYPASQERLVSAHLLRTWVVCKGPGGLHHSPPCMRTAVRLTINWSHTHSCRLIQPNDSSPRRREECCHKTRLWSSWALGALLISTSIRVEPHIESQPPHQLPYNYTLRSVLKILRIYRAQIRVVASSINFIVLE